jgi:hypothetical protein
MFVDLGEGFSSHCTVDGSVCRPLLHHWGIDEFCFSEVLISSLIKMHHFPFFLTGLAAGFLFGAGFDTNLNVCFVNRTFCVAMVFKIYVCL